jgi:hypothetical protein
MILFGGGRAALLLASELQSHSAELSVLHHAAGLAMHGRKSTLHKEFMLISFISIYHDYLKQRLVKIIHPF